MTSILLADSRYEIYINRASVCVRSGTETNRKSHRPQTPEFNSFIFYIFPIFSIRIVLRVLSQPPDCHNKSSYHIIVRTILHYGAGQIGRGEARQGVNHRIPLLGKTSIWKI